jgi:HTH-type transcriptional regulator, sugar sensing transcriptional regulator
MYILLSMPSNKTAPEQTLAALGFTEAEAAVYCELLRAPASTGYRLAQSIGKAAAGVYQALAALSQKGAVLLDDSEAKSYRAVPPAELIAALSKSFEARAAEAAQSLEELHEPQPDDRLYQLSSVDQVFERATAMIERAKEIVLFDLFPEPFRRLEGALAQAATRGVTVAGLLYERAAPAPYLALYSSGSQFVLERWPGVQMNVVADASEHLIALLSRDARSVKRAVWSDSDYLASNIPRERASCARKRRHPPNVRLLQGSTF